MLSGHVIQSVSSSTPTHTGRTYRDSAAGNLIPGPTLPSLLLHKPVYRLILHLNKSSEMTNCERDLHCSVALSPGNNLRQTLLDGPCDRTISGVDDEPD